MREADRGVGRRRVGPPREARRLILDAAERLRNSASPETVASRDVPLDFLQPCDDAGALGRIGPYVVTEVVGQGGMGIQTAPAYSLLCAHLILGEPLGEELDGLDAADFAARSLRS